MSCNTSHSSILRRQYRPAATSGSLVGLGNPARYICRVLVCAAAKTEWPIRTMLPEPMVDRIERGVRRALATRQMRTSAGHDVHTSISMDSTTLTHVGGEVAKERGAAAGASPAKVVLAMLMTMMHKLCYYSIIRKYFMLWS
ncbi:hypothetical protein P3342_001383 [Pyrenophora teres f. teres]|nr:hypothetical protein P3342_001383 [Pyrenophora teres f. teres]